jgi:hypothetical protein
MHMRFRGIHLTNIDGIVGEGFMEDLQLIEELWEPEPQAVITKLDCKVDNDHDHRYPEERKKEYIKGIVS